MRIGRETQLLRLGQIAGNGIIFKVAEMGSHQCVIIPVGTDVKGVEVTEIHKFFNRSLEGTWLGGGDRIFLYAVVKALGLAGITESVCRLSLIRVSLLSAWACKESDRNRKRDRTICFILRFFVVMIDAVRFTNGLPFVDFY